MRICPYFWILLCLVVGANARSVNSTHDESGAEVLRLLLIGDVENQAAFPCVQEENIEECKKLNKVCIRDDNIPEGFRCACRKGDLQTEDGDCIDVCELEESIYQCNRLNKVCIRDDTAENGFKCACRKGDFETEDGDCVDVCDLEENIYHCQRLIKVCVSDRQTENGFKCVCRKGDIETEDGKCVGVCEYDANIKRCDEQRKECVKDDHSDEGFKCVCPKGFVENDEGKCIEIPFNSTSTPTTTSSFSTFNFTAETTSTILQSTLAPITGKKIDAYIITLVATSVFLAIVLIVVSCVLCQRYCAMKR